MPRCDDNEFESELGVTRARGGALRSHFNEHHPSQPPLHPSCARSTCRPSASYLFTSQSQHPSADLVPLTYSLRCILSASLATRHLAAHRPTPLTLVPSPMHAAWHIGLSRPHSSITIHLARSQIFGHRSRVLLLLVRASAASRSPSLRSVDEARTSSPSQPVESS